MTSKAITGFLSAPKLNAQNKIYRGRFTCPDVQWTGTGQDSFATFTITAGELADAAASGLLWTDQDVQRGIQPAAPTGTPRELSLATGYPAAGQYVFDAANADNIAEKLLGGEQLFLNPLVWNMRPSHFEAYWDGETKELYIYSGKIYLPDSHHRHQAIVKAVNNWRDAPKDYPKFNDQRQFKIELYFLTRTDEGNYFFDKNQRPKPTAKSKAYDLTTQDDLSLLAKRVIDKSSYLTENVNRVTDRLDTRNPQVMTLSTLREMMRTFASDDVTDSSELDGMAVVAAEFYDMIANVRPELAKQETADRRVIRRDLLVDAAVMMHGYAYVMREYNNDLGWLGTSKAREKWRAKIQLLSSANVYHFDDWSGDFFDKKNPLWMQLGILRPGSKPTKITILNTGAARSECGRVLRQLLALDHKPDDISFLARR